MLSVSKAESGKGASRLDVIDLVFGAWYCFLVARTACGSPLMDRAIFHVNFAFLEYVLCFIRFLTIFIYECICWDSNLSFV